MLAGVPWWPSGLRIWCCRCCGLGHCYSMGSMPDPAAGIAKKKKKKEYVSNNGAKKLGGGYGPDKQNKMYFI